LSNLLPIESLTRDAQPARQGFELAAPNAILGKTVFLRLPVASEWSYEVDPAGMRAERDLIRRDQMWVTRGRARFVAVHSSGARCEITVRVRPWNPRHASKSRRQGPSDQLTDQPPDERISTRSLFERLGLARPSLARLIVRCHHTEREIEIRWKSSAPADLERLLASFQCH
jgi:hypothetical protein